MDINAVVGLVTSAGILIFGALFVLTFVGIGSYLYWFRYRRYQEYKISIFEKDNFGNIVKTEDDGAIFTQGSNKRLWLRKANVSLNADNIPYMICGKQKQLYLFRKGHKNYVFVNVKIDSDKLSFEVGEEDINWGLISYANSKKQFGESIWMQLAPYGIVLVSILVVFAIFFMLIKKFDILLEIAQTLKGSFQSSIV